MALCVPTTKNHPRNAQCESCSKWPKHSVLHLSIGKGDGQIWVTQARIQGKQLSVNADVLSKNTSHQQQWNWIHEVPARRARHHKSINQIHHIHRNGRRCWDLTYFSNRAGGWKQNLYYQGWERFIFKFFCFTHPSYPQQGTLHVANGYPHHPIQDGHTNKADLQTQHAPKKETLMSICSPPCTKPPAQEQVSRQTELAQVPSCGWCCLLDGSGCKKNLSNTALWARHRDSVLNTDSSGIQAGVPEHCWNGSMPTVFIEKYGVVLLTLSTQLKV